MTKEKLVKTLLFYKNKRKKIDTTLSYKIMDMVDRIIPLIEEQNKIEKGMRWLGFIQGVFWTKGYSTIDELKGHSRKEV